MIIYKTTNNRFKILSDNKGIYYLLFSYATIVFICLLVFSVKSAIAIVNPAAAYCSSLGYEFAIESTPQGDRGICRLPNNASVDAWEFLQGKTAKEYSYCSQKGYQIKTTTNSDKCSKFLLDECAVCVLENGEEPEVTELMNLSFVATSCGDRTCGFPENFNTCPSDCPSGNLDEYCDGLHDSKCDPDCLNSEDSDCIDSDGDGIPDYMDNCPNTANADQADTNNNGIGNACEPDTTPPTISISSCPQTVNLAAEVSVTVNVSDDESGVAYQSEPNGVNVLDTLTVGTKTFSVTAKDNRGNSGANSCSYRVIYDFLGTGGFQPPVDDPPITNTGKAGSSIPVKWQLPDGKNGFISDLGAVTSVKFQQVSCSDFSSSPSDPVETTATGGTGLRYDLVNNQYVYNWQTSKTWTGKCYILNLSLNDGMSYQADFSLK